MIENFYLVRNDGVPKYNDHIEYDGDRVGDIIIDHLIDHYAITNVYRSDTKVGYKVEDKNIYISIRGENDGSQTVWYYLPNETEEFSSLGYFLCKQDGTANWYEIETSGLTFTESLMGDWTTQGSETHIDFSNTTLGDSSLDFTFEINNFSGTITGISEMTSEYEGDGVITSLEIYGNYLDNVLDLSNLNVSNCTTFNISEEINESGDPMLLCNWKLGSSTTGVSNIFTGQTGYYINCDVSNWDFSGEYTDFSNMFNGGVPLYGLNTWNFTYDEGIYPNLESMFEDIGTSGDEIDLDLSNWDLSSIGYYIEHQGSYTDPIINNCYIGELNLTNWTIPEGLPDLITNGSNWLSNQKIDSLIVTDWDIDNVTNFDSLFKGLEVYSIEGLETWDISNVTSAQYMFYHPKLYGDDSSFEPEGLFNGISGWNVSNITNYDYMFAGITGYHTRADYTELDAWIDYIDLEASFTNIFDVIPNSPSQEVHVDLESRFPEWNGFVNHKGTFVPYPGGVTSSILFKGFVTTRPSSTEGFEIGDAVTYYDSTNAKDTFYVFDGEQWVTASVGTLTAIFNPVIAIGIEGGSIPKSALTVTCTDSQGNIILLNDNDYTATGTLEYPMSEVTITYEGLSTIVIIPVMVGTLTLTATYQSSRPISREDASDTGILRNNLTVTLTDSDNNMMYIEDYELTTPTSASNIGSVRYAGITQNFNIGIYDIDFKDLTVQYDTTHVATDAEDVDTLKPYLTVTVDDESNNTFVVDPTDYTLTGSLVAPSSTVLLTLNSYYVDRMKLEEPVSKSFTIDVEHQTFIIDQIVPPIPADTYWAELYDGEPQHGYYDISTITPQIADTGQYYELFSDPSGITGYELGSYLYDYYDDILCWTQFDE